MKYSQFEGLVFALGFVAVIGTLAFVPAGGSIGITELIAQLLILVVLGTAVHYGPKGGFIAALAASLAYVLLRVPAISQPETSANSLLMLLMRFTSYGLIGVVGGHACTKIKYVLSRLEDVSTVDEWSGVFNQTYAASSLDKALGRLDRYSEDFSAVVVKLSPSLTADLRPARQRSMIRSVSSHICSDVRIVDEVARLDDGRFLVILPHTPKVGGEIVTARVGAGVRRLLGARDESVRVKCLSGAEDRAAIKALLDEIKPDEPLEDQSASGEYKSDEASTRNPAETSRDSAAGSSTFSTSTAALPEGSTKQ
jgi:GGDEF domain-containing protein